MKPPRVDGSRWVVAVRNRQRTRRVDTRLLRQLTHWLLETQFAATKVELCFHLVASPEMARINAQFLQHEGSTDVITFDHSSFAEGSTAAPPGVFHGEIFICLDDAVAQAREFRTTWPEELVRYVIHGLLHLAGYDDLQPALRREMKRAENRLLRATAKQVSLSRLARAATR